MSETKQKAAETLQDKLMFERDFQVLVIDLFQRCGWERVHAERPARNKDGWVTPIQGNPGFPDILALKGKRQVVAELKSEKGEISNEQYKWLSAYKQAGAEVYIWRPRDWETIKGIAQGGSLQETELPTIE